MKIGLRLLFSFLAGAIAVGGFHPFEIWFFPIVSLLIPIALLRHLSLPSRLIGFYLYGSGFLLPLLHWSSTYVGSFPWIALSLGFATFFSLLAFAFRENQVRPLTFTFIFMAAESARAIMPFGGFGWGRYGFSQLDGPLEQWLRIGGVSLMGGVVAFAAALLVTNDRRRLMIVPLVAVGYLAPFSANASEGNDPIRIGLVQGGVSQLGLDFNATPREVLNRHLLESEVLLSSKRVDVLIWPENASDIDPLRDADVRKRISTLIKEYRVPMVVGAVVQGELGPENVSILFDRNDAVSSIYQKRDLVPFGEYVPLRSLAAKFSPLVDGVKDFVPGSEIAQHRVTGIDFSPLICYEVLDDRVTWDNLKRSSVGVVQTNNATFGRSWQSGQQFQITRVRAFESRIPFVIAATTGDTAQIDENGEVVSRLPKFQTSHMVVSVKEANPSTPPLGPEFLFAFSVVGIFFLSIRDLKKIASRRSMPRRDSDLMDS